MLNYPPHVTKETAFTGTIQRGDVDQNGNHSVRRVQEWLKINGFATGIDGDFGPATEKCVVRFQHARGLPENGRVDQETWNLLIAPLTRALAPLEFTTETTVSDAVLQVAQQHLAEHPIEVGGDNRGPWVRTYVEGHQGLSWRWCAGFITFVMNQACMQLDRPSPIEGSVSCDVLAGQAKEAGLFVRGSAVASGEVTWDELGSTQIFLVRRTSTDWTHTGFSFNGDDTVFSTIEGNTNEDGSANGFEVARRMRSLPKKDFIRLL